MPHNFRIEINPRFLLSLHALCALAVGMTYFVAGRVVGRVEGRVEGSGIAVRSERGVAEGEDASASPRAASTCVSV